jgi:aminoglycoside phosphotransferase (APT) family kinase protein
VNDFLTAHELARRTRTAVAAAVGAARERGLAVTDAVVLHDLFSVVVHLAPSPVVARVPTVLPPGTTLDQQARRQQTELDVVQWLADQGTPVVPPSPLVPRTPAQRDGFSITFWQYVEEGTAKEPDYAANAEATAELHAALRSYPGRLSFLSTADPHLIPESFALLTTRPDLLTPEDLDRAHREWEVLEPLVVSRAAFEHAFPGIDVQPVHGDCPPANILHGRERDLYADFELVTLGPVEWDLATLGPELTAAYDRGARRAGLRTSNAEVLTFVDAVGMLRALTALALAPQLPQLTDYLFPAVDRWRATPFAGGFTPR